MSSTGRYLYWEVFVGQMHNVLAQLLVALVAAQVQARWAPISPLIPLLFFPLVPTTSWNFLELPLLPFLLSHTFPHAFVFLILALLSCALSTVRAISQTFSTSSTLLLRFVRFLIFSHFRTWSIFRTISRAVGKVVLGDPRTPGNVKVIAGDR